MKQLIFLGGTCGNNNWRKGLIARLVARGVPTEVFFNPVVEHWNEEAQRREEEAKAAASHMLFYLATPERNDSNQLSAYSMVEATMALYDKPETTVVVFETVGMSGHPLKAMNQTLKVLRKRFANANIFATPQEAEDWLATNLTKVSV